MIAALSGWPGTTSPHGGGAMFTKKPLTNERVGPLPLPAGPWHWSQRWSDLLFMHWQVAAATLRPHVPARLDLDLWDGTPWVSLVAFRLERVRHRRLKSMDLVPDLIELNLCDGFSARPGPHRCATSPVADPGCLPALDRELDRRSLRPGFVLCPRPGPFLYWSASPDLAFHKSGRFV
jgi:hypothetical protein